jgi:DNA-binding transcriptional regulator YiaG
VEYSGTDCSGPVGYGVAGMDGQKLKALRKELKLSLAQAARQVEISPRTWARWEAGDSKPPEGAIKLFLILNKLEQVPE